MSTQQPPDRRAVLVTVTGRVQGVAYRAWTRDEARRLGLGGWVCNESDGTVRALVVGPAAEVDRMVARMQDGPPAAAVTAVTREPFEPVPDVDGFRILR
jgi:acylphosphatase